MPKKNTRSDAIRRFILEHLAGHPTDIISVAAKKFHCTRQAMHKHVKKLIAEGVVTKQGETRNKTYELAELKGWRKSHRLKPGFTEDTVWREDIAPHVAQLPENAQRIWHYGVTEIINNVIDHSEAKQVELAFSQTTNVTSLLIIDDGIGIFRKIQKALNLADEKHAVLELAKGKFTTDPAHHSGEGIFFTSRLFDSIIIESGNVLYFHTKTSNNDWIEDNTPTSTGTFVFLRLANNTTRTPKIIFDQFASEDDDYGFTKTIVPVRLVQYGDDILVSRSQAKRLLTRFDRFKTVILDFTDVQDIGQAFADEVFRVFKNQHPEVTLIPENASPDVMRMIKRALAHDASRR